MKNIYSEAKGRDLSYIIGVPEGAMLRQEEVKQNAKSKGCYW